MKEQQKISGEFGLIITTTDPITGEHLHNLDSKPFIVEGEGDLAVKIYFESEDTRQRYLDTHSLPSLPGKESYGH
jgi:hypothetical protein